jgi:hypothetical protein
MPEFVIFQHYFSRSGIFLPLTGGIRSNLPGQENETLAEVLSSEGNQTLPKRSLP